MNNTLRPLAVGTVLWTLALAASLLGFQPFGIAPAQAILTCIFGLLLGGALYLGSPRTRASHPSQE